MAIVLILALLAPVLCRDELRRLAILRGVLRREPPRECNCAKSRRHRWSLGGGCPEAPAVPAGEISAGRMTLVSRTIGRIGGTLRSRPHA